MANYWMHNGHLQVEGEKMSKSLGNFVTIHELLHTEKFGGRSWPGEVLRLALLRTHYRQPIDFTVNALHEGHRELRDWSVAIEANLEKLGAIEYGSGPLKNNLFNGCRPSRQLLEILSDDFNTP